MATPVISNYPSNRTVYITKDEIETKGIGKWHVIKSLSALYHTSELGLRPNITNNNHFHDSSNSLYYGLYSLQI
jgi:hypothetical protein